MGEAVLVQIGQRLTGLDRACKGFVRQALSSPAYEYAPTSWVLGDRVDAFVILDDVLVREDVGMLAAEANQLVHFLFGVGGVWRQESLVDQHRDQGGSALLT